MSNLRSLLLTAILGVAVASCATDTQQSSDLGPLKVRQTALGAVLTDAKGMTLYTYKEDPAGGSACFERCARTWPPVQAAAGMPASGKLSVIERKDGMRQYAYNGQALYLWIKDKEPGQTTGHNVGEVWFAARP